MVDAKVRSFKLALCQLKAVSDKAKNLQSAKTMVTEAANKGAQVIVLPEMFTTPFTKEHMLKNAEPVKMKDFNKDPRCEASKILSDLAKKTSTYIIGGSIPESIEGSNKIYNTCLCFDRKGNITAMHRKQHLFDVNIPGGIVF